jgi:hypothetical protein
VSENGGSKTEDREEIEEASFVGACSTQGRRRFSVGKPEGKK